LWRGGLSDRHKKPSTELSSSDDLPSPCRIST
jgi:hypothetical protein